MSGKLQIRLFGSFHISHSGETVPGMHSRRLQTLTSYLLLHRNSPQSRQYIAFTFWPDSNESQALTNLRQALHLLRQAIPDADSFLQINNRTVQWKPDSNFTLDVAEFESLIHQAESYKTIKSNRNHFADLLEKAVEVYRGDLFPQCYEPWIEPYRNKSREQFITALVRLIEDFEGKRFYQKAIYYAERLLTTDKLREKTYLDLMRLHALNNDRAGSIKTYKLCEQILKKELDFLPGAELREFYEQITNDNHQATGLKKEDKESKEKKMPLVGRQNEWKRLQEIWKDVTGGNSHFVVISGEAGIGKTRLALEMVHWASNQNYITASARCYTAENTLAYSPVNEWLRAEPVRNKLCRLDPVYLSEVSRILPDLLIAYPELSPPQAIQDSWQRRNFLEALSKAILISDHPMLLFIDDLQWCDEETLEWIHFLLSHTENRALLVLGTTRIEEVDKEHPLRAIARSLQREGKITEIELAPLNAFETGILAEQTYGDELEDEMRKKLYEETEGNPFFLIESIYTLMDESDAEENFDFLSRLTKIDRKQSLLPNRVQNVIRSRFAMLSDEARSVASTASAIGRSFTFGVLQKITGRNEEELRVLLEELLLRRILRGQNEELLDFCHDKIREFAYASLQTHEKTRLHQKMADVLLNIHGINADAVSSQVAYHFDKAGNAEEAIRYYEIAADHVKQFYALREASRLLKRALELLADRGKDASEKPDPRELSIRLKLGPMLVATQGYHAPETLDNYHRIHILSSRLGEPVSAPRLRSMAISCICQGDLMEARRLGEQILEVAKQTNRSVLRVEGHYVTGVSSFWLGDYSRSAKHLKESIDHYDPAEEQTHIDYFAQHPMVICKVRLGLTNLFMGFADRAVDWMKRSMSDARTCDHPFSLSYFLYFGAYILGELGKLKDALKMFDECVQLTGEKGLYHFFTPSSFYQNWLQFNIDPNLIWAEKMEKSLKAMRDDNLFAHTPHFQGLIASAYLELGKTDAALQAVDKALEYTEERGEVWSLSKILRMKGDIVLANSTDPEEADGWYQKALDTAQKQGASLMALRAATKRAELHSGRETSDQSIQQLRMIYDRFTEGHHTPDLKKAARLLDL